MLYNLRDYQKLFRVGSKHYYCKKSRYWSVIYDKFDENICEKFLYGLLTVTVNNRVISS